jgi:hypothetical protein
MAEVRISQASQDALKARLATPEGKEALKKLAKLIAESAFEAMSPDLLASLETKEGMAAFREVWPDIVDAFLFRRGSKPAATADKRKGARRTVKRRRVPPK